MENARTWIWPAESILQRSWRDVLTTPVTTASALTATLNRSPVPAAWSSRRSTKEEPISTTGGGLLQTMVNQHRSSSSTTCRRRRTGSRRPCGGTASRRRYRSSFSTSRICRIFQRTCPSSLSSLEFPHRNADAYLRDAELDGQDFLKTEIGQAIFGATAQTCGPLIAWFPQALLYGFWQSHLGKKRQNTKHARAWVSEIVGWQPASTETRILGLKGDALNLNTDDVVTSNPDDRTAWEVGKGAKIAGAKSDKLSEIGHGQVPFMGNDAAAAAVSFARVTQRATVSFAQLRRVSLGGDSNEADAAVRALLVALGLHAHELAFGRGFALRSGAELRPKSTTATLAWCGW